MTAAAATLMGLTLVAAGLNWWAVGAPARRAVELVAKPLTLLLLIGVASMLQPADPTVRAWFVVALVFSLFGDVFLLFAEKLFVFGLASFLIGHLAYIAGFCASGTIRGTGLLLGLVVVTLAWLSVGRRILDAVRRSQPAMTTPVIAYVLVISVMVVCAMGSANAWAIAGSLLFYASDSLIAWNRFLQAHPYGRLAIIVSYHLGQIGLVLSLL